MTKALILKNINKNYGNKKIIDNINLTINEKDFYALIGPNGAGKSTIINIITGLTKKNSGKVFIFEKNIDHYKFISKFLIGLVPQESNCNLFENIKQILLYNAGYYGINYDIANKRINKYLVKLNLWNKRFLHFRKLSGGMKKRLMIARSLIHKPKLLILDEPTSGVDIELRKSMWLFLKELNIKGMTIILITHYLEEAENLCNRAGIIYNGSLIENTSMKKLLKKLNSEIFILNINKNTNNIKLNEFNYKKIDKYSLEIEINYKQSLNDIFLQLNSQNINILRIHNKVSRLEKLFIDKLKIKEKL
ncbi:ABC transporter ATP-binding protein [Candidatus Annandia adelgestsuga]|uniref:ABC transporter ATP-binding protein n=1 Tax=Candidatus Annandia adelgestsuga TaxID=1302411 RepID=UPI000F7D928D|nr:ABC transporter ATP-binding protein [Candidatus Annandia adelgestsuga]